MVIDRLDTPPSYYRPYLRSVFGVVIVHIIIGAPFNIERTMGNEIFLTLAWQVLPSLPQAIHSEVLTGIEWYVTNALVAVLSGTISVFP